jgi:polysaccharide export outer membrane protein
MSLVRKIDGVKPAMLKSVCFGLILMVGAAPQGVIAQESIPSRELVQYVRDAKKAGLTDAQIQQNALTAGWNAASVREAMDTLGGSPKKMSTALVNPKAKEAEPKQDAPKIDAAAASSQPGPVTPTVKPAVEQPAPAPERSGSDTAPAATMPATVGTTAPRTVQRNVPDEYRIGEGDVLQVNVWGERDASVGSVVVRPDGMITMPLIKDIRVAGLSPAEAEKAISDQLNKLIKAADVTVIVNQINSKKVFMVGGGIKKEGPVAYTYRMTVMQAISEAGALTDYAKRKKIYVLRNENGRQFKLPFAYDAVLNGEHTELNIPLMPGDTLVVPNH